MAYTPTNWENDPSTRTPINAQNLNKIEQGLKTAHTIAESKIDAAQAQTIAQQATADKITQAQAQTLINTATADKVTAIDVQNIVDVATDDKINETQAQALIDQSISGLTDGLATEVYVNTQVDTKLSEYAQQAATELNEVKTDIADNTQRIQAIEDTPNLDEKVKMTADGAADYLQALLDGVTIVNNSGKLTVENLNGLLVTKEDLNQLAGVKANIQGQIDALSSVGEFKGAKDTKADLDAVTDPLNSDMYIVLRDETHDNVTTMYMYNGSWVYVGEFAVKIRDFVTEPLDLATEATGTLPIEHIPTGTTADTVATGSHTHETATATQSGFMSNDDKSKLDAIAAGATANDTDANLKNRANHTGTQPFSTISGTATPEQIPELDAAKIASGTLAIERIPVGTTTGTVADGAHTHTEATEAISGFMSAADKLKLDRLNLTAVDSPVINISDPPSQEEIQAAFDSIVAALEKRGSFVNNTHLFMNGEQGAWFDPNDLSTLFQDAAGTIPVTAVGQPVGLVLDKSGNGNNASQTNETQKPTLQQNAETGAYFLRFDGSNDVLSTNFIDMTAYNEVSMFLGFENRTFGQPAIICEFSENPVSTDGGFGLYYDVDDSLVTYTRGTVIGASRVKPLTKFNASLSHFSLLQNFVSLRDQNSSRKVEANFEGDFYGNHRLYIGRRGAGIYSSDVDIYGVLILSRLTVLNESNKTLSSIANKMEKLA